MGGALTPFSVRASELESKGVFSFVSRESALVMNNILLAVSSFVVFVGTIWPLVAELFFDRKLSVGAPFFNLAFTPFMIALGLILPIGAIVPWKQVDWAAPLNPCASRSSLQSRLWDWYGPCKLAKACMDPLACSWGHG